MILLGGPYPMEVIVNWSFHESSVECHRITNPDETEDEWIPVGGHWNYTISGATIGNRYTVRVDTQAGDSMSSMLKIRE